MQSHLTLPLPLEGSLTQAVQDTSIVHHDVPVLCCLSTQRFDTALANIY